MDRCLWNSVLILDRYIYLRYMYALSLMYRFQLLLFFKWQLDVITLCTVQEGLLSSKGAVNVVIGS